jgi:hypothetical protein
MAVVRKGGREGVGADGGGGCGGGGDVVRSTADRHCFDRRLGCRRRASYRRRYIEYLLSLGFGGGISHPAASPAASSEFCVPEVVCHHPWGCFSRRDALLAVGLLLPKGCFSRWAATLAGLLVAVSRRAASPYGRPAA